MHLSWKHWWRAMSQTQCPTALYILVCSCSAMRSWLDMWQRSASCWTSWLLSYFTWWRVALLKVSFRVSRQNKNKSRFIYWTDFYTCLIIWLCNIWKMWLMWYCFSLHIPRDLLASALKSLCQLGFLSFIFFPPIDEENSRHVVVNCSEALLKNNTYWPLVSDFINILSHQSVAKKFLEDHSLLMLWMSFVSFFQGKT